MSQSHGAASVEVLTTALENEHEIKREVASQVMAWFGDITLGTWTMDVDAVLKQVGLGILRAYKVRRPPPISLHVAHSFCRPNRSPKMNS
jgi:sister chromatid cohesion protein DCC1